MPENLTDILKQRIALHGPISVADYMAEALGHPTFGYYRRKDPLGVSGDFTTAPEISQMFGELVGLWCGVCWRLLGGADKIHLVELGPGRGTLMADALRAAKGVPGFMEAIDLHLVETSPALRAKQKQSLLTSGLTPSWHDDISSLPMDAPLLIIANEFFDALPIRQYVRTDQGWCERGIIWDEKTSAFGFTLSKAPTFPLSEMPQAKNGAIFELCPAATHMARALGKRLARQQGAALVFDYGHGTSAPGDTLQALRDHKFFDVLKDPGSADITAHVDLDSLSKAFVEGGATAFPLLTQGDFLIRLGIRERAQQLAKNNPEKGHDLTLGLNRLIDEEQMGSLFKVLSAACAVQPPGFDQI